MFEKSEEFERKNRFSLEKSEEFSFIFYIFARLTTKPKSTSRVCVMVVFPLVNVSYPRFQGVRIDYEKILAAVYTCSDGSLCCFCAKEESL